VAGVAVVAGVAGPAKVLATLFSDSYRDSYDPTKGSGCRSEPVLSPPIIVLHKGAIKWSQNRVF
jgi:hypothetical protein